MGGGGERERLRGGRKDMDINEDSSLFNNRTEYGVGIKPNK